MLTYPVENKIIKETMCSPGPNTIDSTFVDFTKVGKEPMLILVDLHFNPESLNAFILSFESNFVK